MVSATVSIVEIKAFFYRLSHGRSHLHVAWIRI